MPAARILLFLLGDALMARDFPEAKTGDVEINEGARLVSGMRLYLRIERGEESFDLCAAPFGVRAVGRRT